MNINYAKKLFLRTIAFFSVVGALIVFFIWLFVSTNADERALGQRACVSPDQMVHYFSIKSDNLNHVVCQQPDGSLVIHTVK